jgi:uncharacterized protein (DUF433 family)
MKPPKAFSKAWGDRITIKPDVLNGSPCVTGTTLEVHYILELLAAGNSTKDILEAVPALKVEDIEAVLDCAAYAFKRYNQED